MQPEHAAPELAFTIREGRESDRPYITHAWVAANADTPLSRELGAEYKHAHRRLVWAWLPSCEVRVACDVVDSDAIIGFCVLVAGGPLHYVHVRRDLRRMGVARALVAELADIPLRYTHQFADETFYRKSARGIQAPGKWVADPYPFLAGPQS